MKLLQMFWLILVTVYIARGRTPLNREENSSLTPTDWSALCQETINYQDEHKIKMVFVCKKFSQWYPEWNQLFFKTAQETLSTNWRFLQQ